MRGKSNRIWLKSNPISNLIRCGEANYGKRGLGRKIGRRARYLSENLIISIHYLESNQCICLLTTRVWVHVVKLDVVRGISDNLDSGSSVSLYVCSMRLTASSFFFMFWMFFKAHHRSVWPLISSVANSPRYILFNVCIYSHTLLIIYRYTDLCIDSHTVEDCWVYILLSLYRLLIYAWVYTDECIYIYPHILM